MTGEGAAAGSGTGRGAAGDGVGAGTELRAVLEATLVPNTPAFVLDFQA